jgi:hypothetical protein
MMALGEHHTPALLMGALTNRVRARRSGVSLNEISDYNQFVTTLRLQLGDNGFTAATTRGAGMTHEQANAFALAAIKGFQEANDLPR